MDSILKAIILVMARIMITHRWFTRTESSVETSSLRQIIYLKDKKMLIVAGVQELKEEKKKKKKKKSPPRAPHFSPEILRNYRSGNPLLTCSTSRGKSAF
jgi:hypothetical protein